MSYRPERFSFDPHPYDLMEAHQQGRSFIKPKQRELGPLDMGEMWTQQVIVKQSVFLAHYGQDPKRNAAWLLALSGCLSNDDSTLPLLRQAHAGGVDMEALCSLALFSNSDCAAVALAQMGVDWASQGIIPPASRYANDRADGTIPNEALIENHIDPDRARARYTRTVDLRRALDVAFEMDFRQVDRFVQGVCQVGLSAQARCTTASLGLRDGKAFMLTLAVINNSWDAANNMLDQPLPQEVLNEALLACAVVVSEWMDEANEKAYQALVRKLIKKGADGDAPFEFSLGALRHLGVGAWDDTVYRKASARQWFLSSATSNPSQARKVLDQLCPYPLPAPPEGMDSWSHWTFFALLPRLRQGEDETEKVAKVLRQVLDLDPIPLPTLKQVVQAVAESGDQYTMNNRMRLLVACGATTLLKGAMSREEFSALLQALHVRDKEGIDVEKSLKGVWASQNLEGLLEMLSPEDAQQFIKQSKPLKAEIERLCKKDSLRLRDMDREALGLLMSAVTEGFSRGVEHSNRPRRTL